MKNILFITHHNNDFDHLLPVILELKKHKEILVKTIACYTKEDILKNKLHRHICETNNIHIDTMTDLCYFSWMNKALTKIYAVTLKKVVRFILLRYFAMCSILFLPDKRIEKYLEINKIDLVIIDQRIIDETLIDTNLFMRFKNAVTEKTDPMNHVLFRFMKRARESSIPIIMMPHGPQPVSQNIPEVKHQKILSRMQKPFRPDFLFACSKTDRSVQSFHYMCGKKSTLFLGDPRFDIRWIKYLEEQALKVYGSTIKKPIDKTVLLYLMDIFIYDFEDNEKYKFQLNKDILSLVNYLPNLEIWVKQHPRKKANLNIEDFIDEDKRKNIRQFEDTVDTNILFVLSDIVVTMSSTIFIQPVIQKKPVIFYMKWKERLNTVTTIFDNIKSKASSQEELIKQYEKITDGKYKINDRLLMFSDNMIEKYIKEIKKILFESKI